MPWFITIENVVEEPCSPCISKELGTKADQPSGWDPEFETNPAMAIVAHFLHPAFTDPYLLCHDSYEFLWDIADQKLRFESLPQVSRRDIPSILAGKRGCIHRKDH